MPLPRRTPATTTPVSKILGVEPILEVTEPKYLSMDNRLIVTRTPVPPPVETKKLHSRKGSRRRVRIIKESLAIINNASRSVLDDNENRPGRNTINYSRFNANDYGRPITNEYCRLNALAKVNGGTYSQLLSPVTSTDDTHVTFSVDNNDKRRSTTAGSYGHSGAVLNRLIAPEVSRPIRYLRRAPSRSASRTFNGRMTAPSATRPASPPSVINRQSANGGPIFNRAFAYGYTDEGRSTTSAYIGHGPRGNKNNQSLPYSIREGFNITLAEDEIIVMWSEFNNSVGKVHDMFATQFPDCLFVRVVRVGPDVLDSSIRPTCIAIVGMGVGLKLDAMTYYESTDHFIIRENDILHHIDLN